MFGPLPWRCDGPVVVRGACVCGAAEPDPAVGDGAWDVFAVEDPGACECVDGVEVAEPPIAPAAAAVAVPAPTMRTMTIAPALAGMAFENIDFLPTVRMTPGADGSTNGSDSCRRSLWKLASQTREKKPRKPGRQCVSYPHSDRIIPARDLIFSTDGQIRVTPSSHAYG
jgi:hypothetical protein